MYRGEKDLSKPVPIDAAGTAGELHVAHASALGALALALKPIAPVTVSPSRPSAGPRPSPQLWTTGPVRAILRALSGCPSRTPQKANEEVMRLRGEEERLRAELEEARGESERLESELSRVWSLHKEAQELLDELEAKVIELESALEERHGEIRRRVICRSEICRSIALLLLCCALVGTVHTEDDPFMRSSSTDMLVCRAR